MVTQPSRASLPEPTPGGSAIPSRRSWAKRLIATAVAAGLLAVGIYQAIDRAGPEPVEVQTNPPTVEVAPPPAPKPDSDSIEVAVSQESTTSSAPALPSTIAGATTTRPRPKPATPAPAAQTTSSTTTTTTTGERSAPPATLGGWTADPSFGPAGHVIESFGTGGDRLVGMALQADGKVVAVGVDADESGTQEGRSGVILRWNSDGSRDETFGNGGALRFVGEPATMALDPDGRILVFGMIGPPTREWNYTTGGVLRVLSGGGVDSTFGHDGIAPAPTGSSGAIAVQSDGKIVVASSTTFLIRPGEPGPGNATGQMVVTRLTPTGGLDLAFGTDGLARIPVEDPEHFSEAARKVVVLDDGSIAVLGDASSYGKSPVPRALNHVIVSRLLPDGRLDLRFNETGIKRISDFGDSAGGSAILGDSRSRILIAAVTPTSATQPIAGYLTRLLPSGEADPTFAGGGRITTPASIQALSKDAQGRIIVAGISPERFQSRLYRYSPDGALESASFGWSGMFGAVQPSPVAIAAQPDGRIVYAGNTTNNSARVTKGWDGDWLVQRVIPTP